jgi:lactoylglutathione lyase
MIIDHIAIWTSQLEDLKTFYEKYFHGKSGRLYHNPKTGLKSYFLQFENGCRLELMQKEGIPKNQNDTVYYQHEGIIHLAFSVNSAEEVDQKAADFQKDGISILRGPRTTGDGYYEFETLDPDGNRLEVMVKKE